ncbi:hypothetical protein ABT024_23685 [Streptomyces sp. NPDC002812]|uniref:hypothetical protein n=1 Tax=Streptomyces sp. NPDC002812 TaxID=3154434 RepID=UPI0033339511
MSARYHLRFQIHPYEGTAAVAATAAELAKTCTDAGVAEVVLLLGAEEHFTGHLSGPDEDLWYEAAALAQEVLLGAGLDVSLNPWVTTGHADRGRTGTHGFAPMVSPTGKVAAAQASFACPRWRAWLTGHYGRFAELGFRVLWLEDDFRFHNHAPLDWGGGFEPLMLDRLAALAGHPVPRPELVAALTASGPPHPLRALWQQVWRTAQLEVAAQVAAEVHRRSAGRSRTGLMSSGLDAASVEGRDWGALFDALAAPGGRAVHRPHFAPYADAPGRELARQLWMPELQRSLRPEYVDSEPEIENWPHTAWSKSDVQTWSEMVAAQLSGADALLLNLHPMQGAHPGSHPGIAELLRRARPALDLVHRQHPRGQRTLGVGLPFAQDAAAHVRAHGGDLTELAVDPGPAAGFLLRYGVPVTAEPAPVQALFGPSAWAFDDQAVRALLAGGLLLDGTAAAILHRRGFGPLIGLADAEPVDREAPATPGGPGPYATEHLCAAAGQELAGLLLSVNTQPSLTRLREAPGAQRWSEVRTPDGRAWGAGRTVFANTLGGRVAVLAATEPHTLPADDHAQRLLHRTIRFLEGEDARLPLVSGGPYLIPHLSHADGVTTLTVANGCQDPARPVVDLPALPDAVAVGATLLAPLAEPRPADTGRRGHTLRLDPELPHRAWAVLRW